MKGLLFERGNNLTRVPDGAKLDCQTARSSNIILEFKDSGSEQLYTVVMCDDSLKPAKLYYLAVNITGISALNLSDYNSNVLLPYSPSKLPTTGLHCYSVKIFKQDQYLPTIVVDYHLSSNASIDTIAGLTPVNKFTFYATARVGDLDAVSKLQQ